MEPFTRNATHLDNTKALKPLPVEQVILFCCDVARLVLPVWEKYSPEDERPRTAIELSEQFIYGKAKKKQLSAAKLAVYNCANSDYHNPEYLPAESAAYAAYYACLNACNAAYAAHIYNASGSNAEHAAYYAAKADPQVQEIIQFIFLQTTPIPIPITPTLQSIAEHIVQTRNFEEYYVLLDNLEEFHSIQLERTIPKGLSHYVLYTLTNTN